MTDPDEPIKPGPDLARQMAHRLAHAIHSAESQPGQRLPTEAVLGQQYGTSRSVVTEVLSMLPQSSLTVSHRGSSSS